MCRVGKLNLAAIQAGVDGLLSWVTHYRHGARACYKFLIQTFESSKTKKSQDERPISFQTARSPCLQLLSLLSLAPIFQEKPIRTDRWPRSISFHCSLGHSDSKTKPRRVGHPFPTAEKQSKLIYTSPLSLQDLFTDKIYSAEAVKTMLETGGRY